MSEETKRGFGEKIEHFATTVFDKFKREEGLLPKAVRDMLKTLEENGEATITQMQIIRAPVEDYVKVLLQGISKGSYQEAVKHSPYDKMFHLSLRLNGKYRLEKNEVISLSAAAEKLSDGAEFVRVALPRADDANAITIRSLLEKTKEYMGPQAFTDYNARNNNCQDFVMAILKANGMCTELLESFTHQDAETIFQGMPEVVTAIAETMTDAAAAADAIVEKNRIGFRKFIANVAQKSKELSCSEQHGSFVKKARELDEQYGKDEEIPEGELRETMAQLQLSLPQGADIVALDLSSEDKADQVVGLIEKINK